MSEPHAEQLTRAQREQLEAELAELEGPRRKEIIEAIAVARAHGDLSENFEYHSAKNEQGLLERRITILRSRLQNAVEIDEDAAAASNVVMVGSHVEIERDRRREDDGRDLERRRRVAGVAGRPRRARQGRRRQDRRRGTARPLDRPRRLDRPLGRSIAPMRELRPGVWHWQSPHPDWNEEQWWPELVSSYGIELGDDFLLFDPLSVPDELRDRATAVVLTAPYHERDARPLGLPVHTPPADTWQDWVEKFGVDPDRVRGMESDDLAWLRAGEGEGHFHGPGAWPFGINAYAGREDNDLILWLPSINAIVTGDSLSDFGDGLDIQLGGRKHVTRDDVVQRLRPLLDLPVELVLPAHGEPTDRAALERVLS